MIDLSPIFPAMLYFRSVVLIAGLAGRRYLRRVLPLVYRSAIRHCDIALGGQRPDRTLA
jgi:hypothetical protein